ncbi:MAG: UDP-glucose--hexose-1-phosphate uridylyltransferase [Succinivibrio sp.]|jgi:UDPglucose--hexose-1-phosphate uridylyltransferase|nr:UDP-glucose--hexose-1-phosphate uridylyltransferase [Succinivibrio sp.]
MAEFDVTSHPHRRYNALTGEWILVSPHRAKRPWLGQVEKLPDAVKPSYDPKCYLCPGNTRVSGDHNPDYKDNFVFTNDFAALMPDTPLDAPEGDDLFRLEPARGTARVICFSPDHSKTLPLLSVKEIRRVVDLWASQFKELSKTYKYVQLFENKGAVMGCSNPHPHGQIWACSFIPEEISKELSRQRAYFQKHGTKLLCDYVKRELELKERIVFETDLWVALVPFWAFWPFETMLLPKFEAQTVSDLTDAQREDLALAVKRLTTRYDNLFETSFPYSMGWHNAPQDGQEHPEWQVHAHYYPPLLRSATVKKFVAGFELLAEKQRDLTAEQAAARLRDLSDERYSDR